MSGSPGWANLASQMHRDGEAERSVETLAGTNEIGAKLAGSGSGFLSLTLMLSSRSSLVFCLRVLDHKDIWLVKQLAPTSSTQPEPPHTVL